MAEEENRHVNERLAQEMLDGAVALIEAQYDCIDGPTIYKCPTGEPYVTLVAGGIKPEGSTFPEWFMSYRQAVRTWCLSFDRYTFERPKGRLYWRWKPKIHRERDGRWQVMSRLIITDKSENDEEAIAAMGI